MRRRWAMLLVAGAALAVVLVVLLRDGGTEQAPARVDPVAQALAHLPADAAVVAVLATDGEGAEMRRLREVLRRIPGAGIALGRLLRGFDAAGLAEDVRADLSGAPVAVAARAGLRDGVLAWRVADAGRLADALDEAQDDGLLRERHAGAGGAQVLAVTRPLSSGPVPALRALAVRGRLLLAATTERLVRDAAGRHDATAAARWRRRVAGLPAGALLRAAGRPSVLLPARVRGLVPGLGRARDAALAGHATEGGLRATVRLDGAAVPLAAGAVPAAPAALDGDLTVAVRDPRTAAPALLQALGADDDVARADTVLRLLRRDPLTGVLVQRLRGTATLALRGAGAAALQLRLDDTGPLHDLLDDVAKVPDLLLGRTGLDVDEEDGAYTVRLPDVPPLRVAVEGDRVGITTGADPRPVATRPPSARTTPGAGALAVRLRAAALRARLISGLRLPALAAGFLTPIGDLTVGIRRTGSRLTADVVLPVVRR